MTTLTSMEYEMILRRDLSSFIERSFYEVNPGKKLLHAHHINLIASRLEDCRLGKIRRLIICIPPRYLKSHCVSVAFVAWLLGHRPATQIICASYAHPWPANMPWSAGHSCSVPFIEDYFGRACPPTSRLLTIS